MEAMKIKLPRYPLSTSLPRKVCVVCKKTGATICKWEYHKCPLLPFGYWVVEIVQNRSNVSETTLRARIAKSWGQLANLSGHIADLHPELLDFKVID
jgi:hypothetical protein